MRARSVTEVQAGSEAGGAEEKSVKSVKEGEDDQDEDEVLDEDEDDGDGADVAAGSASPAPAVPPPAAAAAAAAAPNATQTSGRPGPLSPAERDEALAFIRSNWPGSLAILCFGMASPSPDPAFTIKPSSNKGARVLLPDGGKTGSLVTSRAAARAAAQAEMRSSAQRRDREALTQQNEQHRKDHALQELRIKLDAVKSGLMAVNMQLMYGQPEVKAAQLAKLTALQAEQDALMLRLAASDQTVDDDSSARSASAGAAHHQRLASAPQLASPVADASPARSPTHSDVSRPVTPAAPAAASSDGAAASAATEPDGARQRKRGAAPAKPSGAAVDSAASSEHGGPSTRPRRETKRTKFADEE